MRKKRNNSDSLRAVMHNLNSLYKVMHVFLSNRMQKLMNRVLDYNITISLKSCYYTEKAEKYQDLNYL